MFFMKLHDKYFPSFPLICLSTIHVGDMNSSWLRIAYGIVVRASMDKWNSQIILRHFTFRLPNLPYLQMISETQI